ncbi:unnamed protein product [Hermetia illucens]|uniref:Pyruvate dehydrogenase E1 component subunit alpha n=1 Tax=Hermetia illucens TaxID=343691 RepID=A0A7R8YL75_HERIL|nr:pyruvate dehydrogenase E1 component subunit alpha, mitochondrial-like [Hermetia illucens]CAD7077265.1 unnamed protein product [Hermetia illucens]
MHKLFRGSRTSFWRFARNLSSQTAIEGKPFELHLLDEGPSRTVELTKEEAIKITTQMNTIRKLETVAANLYRSKLIRGFCHLYSGEEACSVGVKHAMRPQDLLITSYRAHSWAYVMGLTLVEILAELTGRAKGCSRGKGGSMHMYAPNFYGGNGIVGAQVPLGTGLALACKYKGDDAVSFTIYGDGAANQGQVFESFNMACLWKLPIIYICENNMYGMGTSAERSSCNTKYFQRGDRIPGLLVDGMDVASVISATRFAIPYALENGPIILEFLTYRYSGHSMSDPGTSYRSRDEVQETRKMRDPITNFNNQMKESGLLTEEDLKAIDKRINEEMTEATKVAEGDNEIPMEELTADVYAFNLEPEIRGVVERNLKHKNINTSVNGKRETMAMKSEESSKTQNKDSGEVDKLVASRQDGNLKSEGKNLSEEGKREDKETTTIEGTTTSEKNDAGSKNTS